jgi:hypothetical protein
MSTLSGGPNIIVDGLVLYLDAANQYSYVSGSTAWNDLSRGGNNSTLINGPTFNTGSGGSIVFDGVDDYSQLSSKMFQGIGNFTFSSTILNTKQIYSQYGGPIYTEWSTGAGTNNTIGFWIGDPGVVTTTSPFRIAIWYQISNIIYQTYSTSTIPLNTVVNISVVRENSQSRIYINGNLDSTTTIPSGSLDIKENNSLIGNVGYNTKYQGNIYTMYVYNRALSAQEVLQNYNATKTRFGL